MAGVIEQLVVASGAPPVAVPLLVENGLWRDQLATTDLGHGVVLVRVRHPAVGVLGGVIGRCDPPVAWGAGAGRPIRVAVLVADPADAPAACLELLGRVARAVCRVTGRLGGGG